MEKFSQFRDRGSGVSPFLPSVTPRSVLSFPLSCLLFALRLPLLLTISITYFTLLQYLPLPSLFKKAVLWLMLGIPGIWWIDLRIDNVKKGSLSAPPNSTRVPAPGSIIASSSTSPIDALYLAAIFDPIFTVSYPHTTQVQYISLLGAIFRALKAPEQQPSAGAKLVSLDQLVRDHPKRIIVVFPECTTTNGQAILPLGPSLLGASEPTRIFPINLRYSPADITTPVPGTYLQFLWALLGRSTHCIRVRIAESLHNSSRGDQFQPRSKPNKDRYLQNVLGDMSNGDGTSSTDTMSEGETNGELTRGERKVLDRVADDLARLGRAKRVGLTSQDKCSFVDAWQGQTKKRL